MVGFRNIGCRFMVGWGRRDIGSWGMIGFNFWDWWSVGCRSRAIKNGASIWGRCRGMIGGRGRGVGAWGRMGNISTVWVHIGGLVRVSFRTGGIFTMFFIHTGLEN